MAGWFKVGDIFLGTSQSKQSLDGTWEHRNDSSLFLYDGTSHALLGKWGKGITTTGEGYNTPIIAPNGDAWIPNWDGVVESRAPDGSLRWSRETWLSVAAVAFDRSGFGWIGSQSEELGQFTMDGSVVSVYQPAEEGRGIDHMVLHEDGHTLLYTSEGESILTWDLRTHLQGGNFVSLGPDATTYGLCRVPDGSYLVVNEDGDRGRVHHVSVNGVVIRDYQLPVNIWLPYGVDVEPNGQYFWVGCQIDDNPEEKQDFGVALRISMATGAVVATIDPNVPMHVADGVDITVVKSVRVPMLKVF